MRAASVNFFRSVFVKCFRALTNGACGVYHIVNHKASLALNVADYVHNFNLICLRAAFIYDSHRAIEFSRNVSRSRNRTYVGRYDHEIVVDVFLEVFIKDRSADKVIDGNIEEALNLICMEIHGKNSVRTRGSYNVRNEFCGDRISRLCFSVLTSITEIRHNRRYSSRRRSSRRVDHDEKFHEVIVNGR